MAHCRVLLCNINKKSGCQDGGFLSISNKDLVTFHFSLAIYPFFITGIISTGRHHRQNRHPLP